MPLVREEWWVRSRSKVVSNVGEQVVETVVKHLDFMSCDATTLAKHVVEVRHVIWMCKIQDVWRVRMLSVFKWRCIVVNVDKQWLI
ncbi:hypothetical protein Tco_1077491 [Tanacetum coccineum]